LIHFINKCFKLIKFLTKLFKKNSIPLTNFTQLHQLGGLRERRKFPANGILGGVLEALALTADSLTKRRTDIDSSLTGKIY